MKNHLISFLLVCAFLVSCAKQATTSKQENIRRIVGGSPLQPGNPGLKSAVALTRIQMGYEGVVCSAVLVQKDLVLTAAHCLNFSPIGNAPAVPEQWLYFTDSAKGNVPSKWKRKVTSYQKHEGFSYYPKIENDVGWIKFEGEMPEDYEPAVILKDPSSIAHGSPITLVGFGSTSDENSMSSGTRLSVETIFNKYLNGLLLLGPTPGKGACHADSGGPAYVEIEKHWYLLGLTSHFDDIETNATTCNEGASIYSSAGYFLSWFEESSGEKLFTY